MPGRCSSAADAPPPQDGPVICVAAALRRELAGAAAGFRRERRHTVPRGRLSEGWIGDRHVALATTGVGPDNARGAVREVFEAVPVEALVIVGFGGALVDGLEAGDLVAPARVRLAGGAGALAADAELLACVQRACRAAGVPVRCDPSVTADRLVTHPGARRALGRASQAAVVDMEGYWLARAAHERGVPFAILRAVSDAVSDHHPALERAFADGRTRPERALLAYARAPAGLAGLPRLLRGARLAADTLRRVGRELFAQLPPSAPEAGGGGAKRSRRPAPAGQEAAP